MDVSTVGVGSASEEGWVHVPEVVRLVKGDGGSHDRIAGVHFKEGAVVTRKVRYDVGVATWLTDPSFVPSGCSRFLGMGMSAP